MASEHIAQLLQDALPNIALDYANRRQVGGRRLCLFICLRPPWYPLCNQPLLPPHCPPICLSVCLLICLFVPGCQSKRMGSRLKDAVEAGAALVRLPRGRRGLLAAPAVCASQTEASRWQGGQLYTKKNTSSSSRKNNSILSEK